MAVVTELLGRPALHEYTKKANKLELNNMLIRQFHFYQDPYQLQDVGAGADTGHKQNKSETPNTGKIKLD